MRTNLVKNITAGVGATVLALGVGLTAAVPAQADVGTPVGPVGGSDDGSVTDGDLPTGNLPGVPEPGSPRDVWVEWAAAERAEAEATDWEADAATRGCELQEVSISDEVDVAYNRVMGAPDDLATHRVEMVEDCDDPAGTDGLTLESGGISTMAIGSGTQCSSTSGPGTMCVSKSSGRIYGSWKYRGSGNVSGFIRIYQISTSASGCYRGSTWLTGGSSTWSSGMTRSISKTRTTYSGYSAHIWKKVWHGHTDWGSACSKL